MQHVLRKIQNGYLLTTTDGQHENIPVFVKDEKELFDNFRTEFESQMSRLINIASKEQEARFEMKNSLILK